jgi:flagellar biosynthetic protein FliR
MNIPIDWAIPQILAFVLVVARLSGLFLLAPVFSSRQIPARVKIMALTVMAVTMTPLVAAGEYSRIPESGLDLVLLIGKETIIGLALGFAVAVVFSAVQVAASFIDTAMGFAMANVIDPTSGSQQAVFGSFYSIVATLSFLAVNGHHWMLLGFTKSFSLIGVSEYPTFDRMFDNVLGVFGQLFVMAFQIAAPVLITLLLADVVLGIVARVVPQMNVFFVGIPLKIGIGMIAVIVALPTFVRFFQGRVSDIITGASVLAGAVG